MDEVDGCSGSAFAAGVDGGGAGYGRELRNVW